MFYGGEIMYLKLENVLDYNFFMDLKEMEVRKEII